MDKSLFARLENGTGYNKIYSDDVTNPHVNFNNYANSQELARSLVAEAIQMRGVEMFYIRREFVDKDLLFGEDPKNRFKKAYRVAMYIQSFDGYEGQRDFFTKFGMQVNDEMTLIISPDLFKVQADGERAKEGDLIYLPMSNSIFEIIWVEPNAPFFQLGQESQYKITAQKFIYSGEEIKPEFKPEDYLFDAELDPVRELDGRMDIKFDQFEDDDFIADEADDFVAEFDVLIGRGTHPINRPKPQADTPFDDFMD